MADARTKQLQEASSRLVLASHVEPTDDIKAERQRATFDVKELSYALNGGKEILEKRSRYAKELSQTSWGDKSRRYFLSHEEEYVEALKGALGIWEKMRREKLGFDDGAIMRILLDFPGGLELHIGMFIPSLLSQGSPEQQERWLPHCFNLSMIGTYAQTELGHGTFVRGLETTATYDPQTQEFILHTPTLTATKWWPGGLGKTATHAVVMARLIVGGTDHGPHGFVVQLRSPQDHKPLPGITVGDIGPKFGFGGVDNGFMSMDHVRIPRDHMLMRFSQVTAEGRYVPPPPSNSKASYATMLFVRADIVKNAGGVLSRAVTIATRYAAVRRQTAHKPGIRETQVLDYQNVSNTLLPLVGSAYALHFMGESMMAMYHKFEADRDKGDFSVLPELHALSCGLKAVCTWITAEGIEACRQTCGGHGYSRLSGLPTLFQSYVQNVTWEGDNNVLCLQTARFLLKAVGAVQQGQAPPKGSAAYLAGLEGELRAKCSAAGPDCWANNAEVQASALRHWACRKAVEAAQTLAAASGGKLAFEGPAWNNSTVVMIRLARAHCTGVLHATFLEAISALEGAGKVGAAAAGVLRQLASLFALTQLEAHMADLLEGGYITGAQASALRTAQRSLLLALRPNAVALVDAFAHEDYLLNSALGRYDGDVYRALLDMAQGSPLNTTEEGPAWHDVLKPAMSRAAARSKM
mmetsp:Transcript_25494/g.55452  ORF Transcript_25494/g.55452 Transcript_25494/m.55452 type:complete len:695 (+) Transcript_25494:125-2209(+)|eukprot:CAMPEP_0202899610 /NCGR_PEP_ID=MMETSP1392-20130828/7791_1 /ASSEMBLY_ACC=CAM_ASM_000868 /TAXON_ID=225041 /ORGANISM="Chlamydomonas chlamydogama, Strain SAG 11-48b" /LENGTH=694 /DNA_ID=CAMNT_0049585837 /DNA_START=108 /DNA_END=2192 /DNA_ORIENTATION=+